MSRSCIAVLVLALAPVGGPALNAQEAYPFHLEPGTRVRISMLGSNAAEGPAQASQVTGRFEGWNEDSLVIDVGGSTTLIGQGQIDKVEVSLGVASNAGKGAWIGALSGFAIGLGIGLACSADADCAAATDDAVVVLASSFAIGAIGAGLGAGIGAATKSERWRQYPDKVSSAGPNLGFERTRSLKLIVSLRL